MSWLGGVDYVRAAGYGENVFGCYQEALWGTSLANNEHRVRHMYVASMVFDEMICSDAVHKTLGPSGEEDYQGYSDIPSSIVVRLILHWLSESKTRLSHAPPRSLTSC